MKPRFLGVLAVALAVLPLQGAAPVLYGRGDQIRLTRSEMLLFKGQKFNGGAKGQEFPVFQHDLRQGLIYVPFYKEDGTLVAVTVPSDAVEAAPPDGWNDLIHGAEAFRDLRIDDAKRLMGRAAQDAQYRSAAAAFSQRAFGAYAAASQVLTAPAARVATARQAFSNTLQALRDLADQLAQKGSLSLAVFLDQGGDRLATQVYGKAASGADAGPPSKLNQAEVTAKAESTNKAVLRARQAIALKRMIEAKKYLEEGLTAEPFRPDLKTLLTKVEKGIADAEDSFKAAESMRHFQKGEVHALTALESGLKSCADYPKLLDLRKQMQSLFEERTAPPINTVMTKGGGSAKALEEGRELYTNRCTECHDLQLLDSRSITNWRTTVAGMSRRANLNEGQQAKIVEYLAAAQNSMDGGQ